MDQRRASEPDKNLRLLNSLEAAGRLGISYQRIRTLRSVGGGPPFIKIGRLVRYRPDDIEAWISARVRLNTAEHYNV